jgi:hypothetical protein
MIKYLTPSKVFLKFLIAVIFKDFSSSKLDVGKFSKLCKVEPPMLKPAFAVGLAIKQVFPNKYFQPLISSDFPVPAYPTTTINFCYFLVRYLSYEMT